jgi:hypothetical protein
LSSSTTKISMRQCHILLPTPAGALPSLPQGLAAQGDQGLQQVRLPQICY